MEDQPKFHVTVSRTVSDGNYGNVSASVMLCNVPHGASPSQIATMLAGSEECMAQVAEIVYASLSHQLGESIRPQGAIKLTEAVNHPRWTAFGHTVDGSFPKSYSWENPATDPSLKAISKEWGRFELSQRQVSKAQTTLLNALGYPHTNMGLTMGQAWLVASWLKQAPQASVNELLVVSEVHEEPTTDPAQLTDMVGEVFAGRK